jgi:hypothetical protein
MAVRLQFKGRMRTDDRVSLDACRSGFPVSTRLPKTIAPLSSFNSTPGYAGQAGESLGRG